MIAVIQTLYQAAEAEPRPISSEGIRLYVGGDAYTVQRRRCFLTGYRMFSAAYGPVSRFRPGDVPQVTGMLDSGAFSDAPEDRLAPESALERQFRWEARASELWDCRFRAEALVSYDLLIDEKWTGCSRKKQRWSVHEADVAVRTTVDAAAYLASQRQCLWPRRLVLACQGVDAIQYQECVQGVLQYATPADILGLGGWCILGWFKSWIPTFWAAMRRVLPLVARAGLSHVHLFGVMYRPVLGPLLWLCDQHGLFLSTDSSGPILQVTWKDQSKAGSLAATWEENVLAWQTALRQLRDSDHYREPPDVPVLRQLDLWEATP